MNKALKIGNITLDNNVVLAPMAGITDIAFRTICKRFGVGLVTTEMVSIRGLYYKDRKTEELMKINQKNRPVSLQIFGNEPEIFAYVVENILNNRDDFDIIDINMGCPAPKIVKNGDGSALMKSPQLAGQIVKAVSDKSNKPVTVKFRAGWDDSSINAVEFAKVVEENGADCIAVHGRTREQFYSGNADYDIISKVKDAVSIPVIGNGDIFKPEDAIRMYNETGCDGVLLARGVLGNPWLIENVIKAFNNDNNYYEPTPAERIRTLKEHAVLLSEETSEKRTVLEMRKHAAWYIKGLKKSAEVRNEINKVHTLNELYDILDEYIAFL